MNSLESESTIKTNSTSLLLVFNALAIVQALLTGPKPKDWAQIAMRFFIIGVDDIALSYTQKQTSLH
jgi:hypothetical protein